MMTREAQAGEKEYLVEYDYAGDTWNVTGIYAKDREEASRKVQAIGRTGRVLGEIAFKGALKVKFEPGPWILTFLLGALAAVVLGQLYA